MVLYPVKTSLEIPFWIIPFCWLMLPGLRFALSSNKGNILSRSRSLVLDELARHERNLFGGKMSWKDSSLGNASRSCRQFLKRWKFYGKWNNFIDSFLFSIQLLLRACDCRVCAMNTEKEHHVNIDSAQRISTLISHFLLFLRRFIQSFHNWEACA